MTQTKRSFYIYYNELDTLLIQAIQPLLQRLKADPQIQGLQQSFWERHYAGGSHLRLHLAIDEADTSYVTQLIQTEIEEFFANHPSRDDEAYNPEIIKELLVLEEEDPEQADLTYRNHQIVVHPYSRNAAKFVGAAPIQLLEGFYEDAQYLILQMLQHPDGKELQMLKIFFLNAWLDNETWDGAGLSYRSHWEGFKMQMQVRDASQLVAAIEAKQAQLAPQLRAMMHTCHGLDRHQDPILAGYQQLTQKYRAKAQQMLEDGQQLFPIYDPTNNHQFIRDVSQQHEISDFIKELHHSDYLQKITQELGFNVLRASTNLMYLLIPALGLAPYHKFKLGYFAFRTIEQATAQDSLQALRQNAADRGFIHAQAMAPQPHTAIGQGVH